MADQCMDLPANEAEVEAYTRTLIDSAAQIRLPDLFTHPRPDAIYHIPDRNGVAVIALRTASLSEEQLKKILQYRLAQALSVKFVDARMAYEAHLEHEPMSNVSPADVHVIAGTAETGQLLCYAVIRAMPEALPGTTLRTRERPLLPVEEGHGWGIFNRLRVLPDLPFSRVREVGRFVKNQRLAPHDARGVRGPVEVLAAVYRLLAAGPLRQEVDAFVGTIEEGVTRKNLAFFHLAHVLIRGTLPYVPEESFVAPVYQHRTEYPFAVLVSDMSAAPRSRLDVIEQALALPGAHGVQALLALRADVRIPRSSLEPPDGLAPLNAAEVPQRDVPLQARRALLDQGELLQATELFASLSVAEATVLSMFMERREVDAAQVIIRQGEEGDDLFLIVAGRAEVRLCDRSGKHVVAAMLGPGEYFGEIALVTGSRRAADVVPITPMTLLRLSRAHYAQYLTHMLEVERQVTRTAACRVGELLAMTRADRLQNERPANFPHGRSDAATLMA